MNKLTEQGKELMQSLYADELKQMKDFFPRRSINDIIEALNKTSKLTIDEPAPLETFFAGVDFHKRKGMK
jgi:hypothetical protein